MSSLSFKTLNNITGWLTFAITAVVLCAAAQPTGSLWDCGEFIAGAYKLQVVHPPGAPVFLVIGRLFAWVATLVSDDPSTIAYAVNVLSALSTAFAATFICWSTTILGRLAFGGRAHIPEGGEALAIAGAGLVAGLVTAFTTSVWFSAVEGEVYAMSTFFTCMTLWSVLKWYNLPDTPDADRWLIFAFFSTALSIGVHLLSLLTFPALAMFYYFKKSKKPTVTGTLTAALVGVVFIIAIQKIIISGIPSLWAFFDKFMVNSMGLPFHTGLIPVFLLFGGALWWGLRRAHRTGNGVLERIVVAFGVVVIAYVSYGMVVIRANANPPINMNDPSDALRMLPYLNREQYGERPLLRGPNFDSRPDGVESEDRYGRVGDRYEIVDDKVDYTYPAGSKVLFPRMQDNTQGRPALYRRWLDKPTGSPNFGDNIEFFFKYQLGWMYWRYFMWNFAGRQNGEQGFYSWDPTSGHWVSGFTFVDEPRIGDQTLLPEWARHNQAHNRYFLIPFFLGLVGMFFHFQRRRLDFAAVMSLFIITGLGIIVYTNQPPSEPRERDYVLAGSFFTYAIWIGLSVLALYELLQRVKLPNAVAGLGATALALSAPLLMVTQNWDDHSRAKQYASRDYARNFLESCAPDAIIFTYGDNDTYPLWYCQEVENIRTDVRVVNLSLIAVDWYIDQLRRAVNNSPAIDMSIPAEQLRGFKRVQIPYYSMTNQDPLMNLDAVIKFMGEDHKLPSGQGRDFDTYLPTRKIFIPVNKKAALASGTVALSDSAKIVDTMMMDLGDKTEYIIKDQLAMMDIVASNLFKRPIYWAVTVREDRLLGLENYLQLEGLALRLTPIRREGDGQYGVPGAGGVATDIAFQNIMEKWKWGNFDKEKQFVDRSFMPSIQTMRLSMIRLGNALVDEKKNDKAIALVDKYFEVFPSYNFPYDQFSSLMVEIYARAGANDKLEARARDIAKAMQEQLQFIHSQPAQYRKGFQSDEQFALGAVQYLMRSADIAKNQALLDELEKQFEPYMPKNSLPDRLQQ